MKNTENSTVTASANKVQVDGVKIYSEPSFVTYRSSKRKFFCRDQNGKLIAEFTGMGKLTDYVCKKSGKSPNYVRQRVYKHLNQKIDFLGYYWTDK